MKAKGEEALKTEPFRLPDTHPLFTRLRTIISDGFVSLEDTNWTPMTERAIHVVYALADHPNDGAAMILKDVVELFRNEGNIEAKNGLLIRLLGLIGQIALQAFVNLDVAVVSTPFLFFLSINLFPLLVPRIKTPYITKR